MSGLGLGARVFPVSGHLLLRILLMLAMRGFATAQFKSFFDCGRALRCVLPLASGRFIHLVLYGYQGADCDAEQLSLTEQLI